MTGPKYVAGKQRVANRARVHEAPLPHQLQSDQTGRFHRQYAGQIYRHFGTHMCE